jgi:hypothetical protein
LYSIRVQADSATLAVVFSGGVPVAELLRAVSQGFALAEAGDIQRALCDLRQVVDGPNLDTFSVIAATFVTRLEPGQRVAILCAPAQLPLARRFARFASIGEELAVFTRAADADEWLAGTPERRLSSTAVRHLQTAAPPPATPVEEPDRASRRAG